MKKTRFCWGKKTTTTKREEKVFVLPPCCRCDARTRVSIQVTQRGTKLRFPLSIVYFLMLLCLSSTHPNPAPLRRPKASIQYSLYCRRSFLSRESLTLVVPQHSGSWHVLLNPALMFAVRQQLRNTSSSILPEIFSAGKKKKNPAYFEATPCTSLKMSQSTV